MPDASRAASRSDDFLPENVGIGERVLGCKQLPLSRRLPSLVKWVHRTIDNSS
jgi:hypothetical protein